ncbi:MAG TPA: ornithine cyclodeaminase family protein [Allosphingosinicella sp.]|jgi:ornithine cyclodeaminase|nr:ornithine cyclodeaminase family protein [Allosphingosinicella sp.]
MSIGSSLLVISREEVAAHLSYEVCIPLVREAMIALSTGRTRQLLRQILDLEGGRAFGVMPGAMEQTFGAKVLSVFPARAGVPSHQGFVALFDAETGALAAMLDASEITGIRTAAASAAATGALARPDARRLAILGTGEQALRHAEAIAAARPLERIAIWGRSLDKARALAERVGGEAVESVEEAVADADIICTVSGASEPILRSAWVKDGTHLNVVGSSRAGPVEIDTPLVRRARFFADHKEGVLRQGAELLVAIAEGAVGEDHVLGEIGEVFAGTLAGRAGPDDVTLYKSLGSIVQDLAAGWYLVARAREEGFGTRVAF